MISKDWLLKKLAEDLSRERVISPQVLEYISGHYHVGEADLADFFANRIPELEEYELDLIFSPLFTPTFEDKAGYAPILEAEALDAQEIRQTVQMLVEKPVYGHFLTPRRENIPMVLKDVMIERFVGRLSLDKPIHPDVYAAIEAAVPENSRPQVVTLARNSVWQDLWRQEMFKAFLTVFHKRHNFALEKVSYLTDFVRTYRPSGLEDLERQLESLIQSCRKDLESVQGRSFHDPHLKELYADADAFNAAVREEERAVSASYQQMIAMAESLQQDYWAMRELMPDVVTKLSVALKS